MNEENTDNYCCENSSVTDSSYGYWNKKCSVNLGFSFLDILEVSMVKCGNRLCKFHKGDEVYLICQNSPFNSKGKTLYINLCPNEELVGSKKEKIIETSED